MESLTRLVSESLSRHGVETVLDPRRLQWSPWFRCESSSSALLVPGKPGVFALAEELISAGEVPGMGGKRMLALFQISEADDLGMALWRLFLPGNSGGDRLSSGRCFARYAMIEDALQRRTAHVALQQWLESSAETASGLTCDSSEPPVFSLWGTLPAAETKLRDSQHAKLEAPAPLPSGF